MRITVASASQALSLKDELSLAGLDVHRDYSWCYHPLIDLWPADPELPWVEFNFRDASLESFYQLKWS